MVFLRRLNRPAIVLVVAHAVSRWDFRSYHRFARPGATEQNGSGARAPVLFGAASPAKALSQLMTLYAAGEEVTLIV